jgi:hypothetical protein
MFLLRLVGRWVLRLCRRLLMGCVELKMLAGSGGYWREELETRAGIVRDF